MRLGSPNNIKKINEDDWYIEPYVTSREFFNYMREDVFGLADFQRAIVWTDSTRIQLVETILRNKSIGMGLVSKQKDDAVVRTRRHDGTIPNKAHLYSVLDMKQRGTCIMMCFGEKVENEDHELVKTIFSFDPTVHADSCLSRIFKYKQAFDGKKYKHIISDISKIWNMTYREFEAFKEEYIYELCKGPVKHLKYNDGISVCSGYEVDVILDNLNTLQEAADFPVISLRVNGITTTHTEDLDTFFRMNTNQAPISYAHKVVSYLSAWVPESRTIMEECIQETKKKNLIINFQDSQLAEMTIGAAHGVKSPAKIKKLPNDDAFFNVELEGLKGSEIHLDLLATYLRQLADPKNLIAFSHMLEEEGYIHSSLSCPKQSAVQYCYILYILGKLTFKIDEKILMTVIKSLYVSCYLPIPTTYASNITDAFVKVFQEITSHGFLGALDRHMLIVWKNSNDEMSAVEHRQFISELFLKLSFSTSGPLRLLYCYQSRDGNYPFLEPAVKTMKSYYMNARLAGKPANMDNDHIWCKHLCKSLLIEPYLMNSSANICKATLKANRGYKSNKEPSEFMAVWEEDFKEYKDASEQSLEGILNQHGLNKNFHKTPATLENFLKFIKGRSLWQADQLIEFRPNYITQLLDNSFDKALDK